MCTYVYVLYKVLFYWSLLGSRRKAHLYVIHRQYNSVFCMLWNHNNKNKTKFLLQVSDDCILCSPEALHMNHGHTQACYGNTPPKQIQYTMTDPKTDLTWQVDSTASATWGGPHVDNTLRNRIRPRSRITRLPSSLQVDIYQTSDRSHHSQTMFSEIVTTHEKVFLRSFRGGYKSQKEDGNSTSCKCTCVLCVVVFTFVVFIVACVITVPLVHGKWSVRGKEVSFSLRLICLFVCLFV